jgi:uncharacterized protein YbjQ (UPF0145 family)
MTRILVSLFAAMALAVAFTGCSTVRTTQKFNDLKLTVSPKDQTIAHINTQVYGAYLFNAFPIFSGGPNDTGKTAAFRDTVTMDNGMYLLTKTAREAGANRVIDVESHYSSTWVPLGLIFWVREIQVSGTAVK